MQLIFNKEKNLKANDMDTCIHKLLDMYELDKTNDMKIFFSQVAEKTK